MLYVKYSEKRLSVEASPDNTNPIFFRIRLAIFSYALTPGKKEFL
jgi:hypothetical protein